MLVSSSGRDFSFPQGRQQNAAFIQIHSVVSKISTGISVWSGFVYLTP